MRSLQSQFFEEAVLVVACDRIGVLFGYRDSGVLASVGAGSLARRRMRIASLTSVFLLARLLMKTSLSLKTARVLGQQEQAAETSIYSL